MELTSRLLTFALLAFIIVIIGLLRIDNHLDFHNKARMGEDEVIKYDTPLATAVTEDETACLVEALYFEVAYHDTPEGIAAVALVIRNRMLDPEFPHTICGVVHQNWYQGSYHHCEFSYFCDGKPEVYRDLKWKAALTEFAESFIKNPPADFTEGRKYYFAPAYFTINKLAMPNWSDCEDFGSQRFCQSFKAPPSVQLASK